MKQKNKIKLSFVQSAIILNVSIISFSFLVANM